MVFVTSERSKSKARDSYFVFRLDDKNRMAIIQKFPMSHFKHHHINVQYQLFYKLSSSPPALALSPSTSSPVLIPKITPPKPKSKFCFTLPPLPPIHQSRILMRKIMILSPLMPSLCLSSQPLLMMMTYLMLPYLPWTYTKFMLNPTHSLSTMSYMMLTLLSS